MNFRLGTTQLDALPGGLPVRLLTGVFVLLAGEALLVAALPGSALILNLERVHEAYLEAQDRQSLAALATLIATEVRAGVPVANALQAAQQGFADHSQAGDPAPPLKGRVALYTPDGARLAGDAPDAGGVRLGRAVTLDGRTIAVAKIVAARLPTAASYAFVRDQLIGIVAAMLAVLLLLLLLGYIIAARVAGPQRALLRASRAIAQGYPDADLSETGAAETRATMRNLGRVARRFDRLESARRTWLVAVSEELRVPVRALGERLSHVADQPLPPEPAEFSALIEHV